MSKLCTLLFAALLSGAALGAEETVPAWKGILVKYGLE